MSVVFPDPLGPSTTQISRSSTASVSPRSAATPPAADGYTAYRSRASTIGAISEPLRARATDLREGAPRGRADEDERKNCVRDYADDHHERVDGRRERRVGEPGAGGDGDEPGHEHDQKEARERARDEPGQRQRERAQAHDTTQKRRCPALGLELVQPAGVLAAA